MTIERLELLADDLAALEGFYAGRLGLPAMRTPDALTLGAGSSRLAFRRRAGFAGRYHFAFNVPENRLEAAGAFLAGRGVALLRGEGGGTVFDFRSWNAHAVYFRDPAGNIAEFIARHDLPTVSGTSGPFSAGEVQNVSEIGLATNDPPGLASALCAALGASPYREGGPAFVPVGDENGLFIVVGVGRLWFPETGVPAEPWPVRAEVVADSGRRFEVVGPPYGVSAAGSG